MLEECPVLQRMFGTVEMEHFIMFKVSVENVEIKIHNGTFSTLSVPSGLAVIRVRQPFWTISTTLRSWLMSQTLLPLLFLTSSIMLAPNLRFSFSWMSDVRFVAYHPLQASSYHLSIFLQNCTVYFLVEKQRSKKKVIVTFNFWWYN